MGCLKGQSGTVLHVYNFTAEGGRDFCKRLNGVFLKQFGWHRAHAVIHMYLFLVTLSSVCSC